MQEKFTYLGRNLEIINKLLSEEIDCTQQGHQE